MNIRQLQDSFESVLPDRRLGKVASNMISWMIEKGSAVVNQFCDTPSAKKSAYRMLENKRFDHKDLIEGQKEACKNSEFGKHVLCINDTTELKYSSLEGKIAVDDEDFGTIARQGYLGYMCHPMLVLDEPTLNPIGFSYIKLFNREREYGKAKKKVHKRTPLEEKESYRWVESVEETKELIGTKIHKTIIADRESDIYEEFVKVPDSNTDLLIRCSSNRRLYESNKLLFETLEETPVAAQYNFKVENSNKRKGRDAQMEVRYRKVKIRRPDATVYKSLPEYVELWVIETKETKATCPEKEDPICWRLYTTHKIEKSEVALKCIDWYKSRWIIEELFRVMKTKGLRVESAQLGSGDGLKKLTVLALASSLKILTLKLSLTSNYKLAKCQSVSEEEVNFMEILMPELEGKTEKLKNPYPTDQVAWFAWGIARLASWSGYVSQGPPGYITLRRGLNEFESRLMGYRTALKMLNKDVGKD